MVGASPHMGEHYLFLETVGSIEPLIWGKMCPQNWFFSFHSEDMFFEENILKRYLVPHFPQKKLYSFLSSDTPPFPEKWSCPLKIIFRCYFDFFFFFEKIVKWKIFKTLFLTKTLIFVARHSLPLKMVISFYKYHAGAVTKFHIYDFILYEDLSKANDGYRQKTDY